MKKIVVSKRTWRTLRKIKNQHNFVNFSKTVDYLIDLKPKLNRESMQEIHHRVDELINAKNLEENSEYDGLDCVCFQCGEPFKLRLIEHDKTEGLQCPNCGFHFFYICLYEEN